MTGESAVPIYEFYCGRCHVVFNFFARSSNVKEQPDCPRCGQPKLERRMSRFAISKGQKEPPTGGVPPDLDDAKVEQMMAQLGGEMDGLDEENPRQMASLMRKLCEGTGMPVDERMEEAIRRMEAGEDPDRIEEDLGDFTENDPTGEGGEAGPSAGSPIRRALRRLRPPSVDETLYDLE